MLASSSDRSDYMATEIQALFRLQGNDDTTTPTEALAALRDLGLPMARRTIEFYQRQGLMPAALRVGSRGGVLPAIATDRLAIIAAARERGIAIEVIRELLLLWEFIVGCRGSQELDLAEFEVTVRSLGLSRETNLHVPWLVERSIAQLGQSLLSEFKWRLKDGTVAVQTSDDGLTLGFAIGEIAPDTGEARIVAWTQLRLPGFDGELDLDDPSLVILGLPVGVQVRRGATKNRHSRTSSDRAAARRRQLISSQEALLL